MKGSENLGSSREVNMSNEEIKNRIRSIYRCFVTSVDPMMLSDYLIADDMITSEEWQRIYHGNVVASDRCRELLQHLMKLRRPDAFLVVLIALKKERHWMVDKIKAAKIPEHRMPRLFCMKRILILLAGFATVAIFLVHFSSVVCMSKCSGSTLVQQCHSCVLTSDRDPSDGRWYNFSTDSFRFVAYSAFLDDRPFLEKPVVRIIAASDRVDETGVVRLICVLRHSAGVKRVPLGLHPMETMNGVVFNHRETNVYIYTCPTYGVIPDSVSVEDVVGVTVQSCMSVEKPRKSPSRLDLIVCVPASFGNLDPYGIIEWIELQKVLGVNRVVVYDYFLNQGRREVFEHYSQTGFVELRASTPFQMGKSDDYWLHSTAVINDCMYRHMHEFVRAVAMNLDELIIPRKHENLPQLIRNLDRKYYGNASQRLNYVVQNNYFFRNFAADRMTSNLLTFLRYRMKVLPSPDGYSAKSLILLDSFVGASHNFCWHCVNASNVYVETDLALNQHYKKCHFSPAECQTMLKNSTQDDTILRFKERLMPKFSKAVKFVFRQG